MSAAAPVAQAPAASAASDLRAWLKSEREALAARYFKRPDPGRILQAHAELVDAALQRLWNETLVDPGIALVAVGGYGRAGYGRAPALRCRGRRRARHADRG